MKKVFLILMILITFGALRAQPPAVPTFDTEWVYVRPYNFERAKKLEWEWEFEKAVWYYINLVPVNLKQAATRVKGIKNHIGNPAVFIITTFKMFVRFDPEVNYMENNELVTHKDVYEKKRMWADQLVQAVGK